MEVNGMKKGLWFALIVLLAVAAFAAPVKVTMWYAQTGIYSQALLDLAEEFNQLHEGKYRVEMVYTGNYQDTMLKLLASMLAGDLPTLAQIEQSRIGQFVDGMAFQDLHEFIRRDSAFQKEFDDYWPRFMAANTYDGKLYAFPLNNSTPLMYYNKDLFVEAGLDPNQPPETWTQVLEVSKRIKAVNPDYFGYRLGNDDWLLEAYLWQFGADIISDDGETMLIYSPEAVECWTFFHKAAHEGYFAYAPTGPEGNTLDLSGRIGMVGRSTGSLAYMIENTPYELGAAVMPREVRQMVPIGGANVFMFASRPQAEKEAGWEFLKFATSYEGTLKYAMSTGYMTSRISAFEAPIIQEIMRADPRYALTYQQLAESAVRRPWFGPYPEVHARITSAWQTLMTDPNVNINNLLQRLHNECQRILDDYYF